MIPTIRPSMVLLAYSLPPAPPWPRGLRLEVGIGKRKRARAHAKMHDDPAHPWFRASLGPLAAVARVRPGS